MLKRRSFPILLLQAESEGNFSFYLYGHNLQSYCDLLSFQPLPEKHSFTKHFDRFAPEFLKSRQIALNKFVSRIADHPVMSFNDNFHVFLTAKTWVSVLNSLPTLICL